MEGGGGGVGKIVGGGYVILDRYLGGLSHIEKPFEGGCLKLYIGFRTFLY